MIFLMRMTNNILLIMEKILSKAITLALKAHEGQVDKSGMPYAGHIMRVMAAGRTIDEKIVGVLHDVVEDTELTLDDLRREFPEEVVEVVALLTHEKCAEYNNTDYFDYIRKIKMHPIAKKVKLADIAHNSDQTRCTGVGLPEEKLLFWQQKYQKALAILMK